ncbi:MAG: histidine--tRNA ligase [Bacilli bacterium]|nr:histidine--tRNA ligase [Bacilli bacterium]
MENEIKLMNLKGTNDYLPEEQLIRNKITNILRETFEKYGYLPLETPMLCYYDLLASKYAGGAEILKEVYKLTDQGGRNIGLRYDLTVPFSKVMGMNKGLILPFKRYEIGKVFRNGPVKTGRGREFYQCDVDACGLNSPYAELEYFTMIKDVFEKLNIKVIIKYNNRKFLSGLLEHLKVKKENINSFIISIDKLDKISAKEIKKELLEHTKEKIVDEVFEYLGKNLTTLTTELSSSKNELLNEGLKELNILSGLINDLGLKEMCKFTPFLARGLDIYTGSVWEIFDAEERLSSALGAGGRYDKIITNFLNNGNEYPAIGMTFGLEPIYELLKLSPFINETKYDIYVYSFERNKYLFEVSNILRQKGYRVLTELNAIKLKKAMNIANREKIKYVILIGDEEIKNASVTLKNMETGEQELIKINELDSKLK